MLLKLNGNVKYNGRIHTKGEEIDIDDESALKLINSGAAVEVKEPTGDADSGPENVEDTSEPQVEETDDTDDSEADTNESTDEDEEEEIVLDDLPVKELKKIAKEAGIKGYSRMSRDKLIKALAN